MTVQIAYQRPDGAAPSPEHVRGMVEWCASEGLVAENIHAEHFVVIDSDGMKAAAFREFARNEDGHRYLIGAETQRRFAKTDWVVRPVSSAPPPFVSIDEVSL